MMCHVFSGFQHSITTKTGYSSIAQEASNSNSRIIKDEMYYLVFPFVVGSRPHLCQRQSQIYSSLMFFLKITQSRTLTIIKVNVMLKC